MNFERVPRLQPLFYEPRRTVPRRVYGTRFAEGPRRESLLITKPALKAVKDASPITSVLARGISFSVAPLPRVQLQHAIWGVRRGAQGNP